MPILALAELPVADISRILKINLALLENARPNPRKLVRACQRKCRGPGGTTERLGAAAHTRSAPGLAVALTRHCGGK